jgi:hypothetical protein
VPFAPWLIKNWAETGNPFFPLLTGIFPGPNRGGSAAAATFAGFGIIAKRQLLYGESWWQIAALPLRLFLSGRDDNPQYFDGVLSPVLIAFLPWAFKGKWLGEKKLLASFALLYLAYALFLVDLRVRYVLPIVPPLVGLMVYGIFNVYLRMKNPRILFGIVGCFALFNGYYLWSYFQTVRPLPYVFGRETRGEYLEHALPEYAVFDHANKSLPDRAKIYLLFMGRRGYYCERDYVHDGGEWPALLMSAIQSARDPSDIERNLQKQGITHLIVREDLLVRFLDNNLNPEQQRRWNGFVAAYLRPEVRNGRYALYRLDG